MQDLFSGIVIAGTMFIYVHGCLFLPVKRLCVCMSWIPSSCHSEQTVVLNFSAILLHVKQFWRMLPNCLLMLDVKGAVPHQMLTSAVHNILWSTYTNFLELSLACENSSIKFIFSYIEFYGNLCTVFECFLIWGPNFKMYSLELEHCSYFIVCESSVYIENVLWVTVLSVVTKMFHG